MSEKKEMSLAAWMYANQITNEEMANLVGCTARNICRWKVGIIPSSLKIALAIQEKTKGQVTLNKIVLEHRQKKSKDRYEEQDE